MKKSLVLILVSLLMVPGLTRSESSEQGKKFRLGVITPFNPDAAYIDAAHRNAETLAAADNPLVDRTLQVTYIHGTTDRSALVNRFDRGEFDALYVVTAADLAAIVDETERHRLPVFSAAGLASLAEGTSYVTLYRNENGEFARSLWEQLRTERKSKIGIIKGEDAALNDLAQKVIDNISETESARVVVQAGSSGLSMGKQLAKLRNEKFDFLGVFLPPRQHREFLQKLQASGLKTRLLGTEIFFLPEFNQGYEELTETALVTAPYVIPIFRQRYREHFTEEAGIEYAVHFYDFLSLLAREASGRKGGFKDADDLIKTMRFFGERRAISGPMSVKSMSRGPVYYSSPIAIYRVRKSGTIVQRLFERPR